MPSINNILLKVYKLDIYDYIAIIIIICATSIRMILAALSWPPTNSDEATMAIAAMNIAYRGAAPLMFYGQDYMGTLEAYLGAGFFHLLGGPSLFALRLGVILLVTLFYICMYVLARLLFRKSLAIFMLLMLTVGSIPVLTRQIIATGGSSQTLFFGSFAFLLAAWLSSTYKRRPSLGIKLRRLVGYGVWGLAVGLGLWSDMVVLPFLVMAGLLLVLFCWRELLVWGWLIVLSCILIGMIPLIRYDLALQLSSWDVLRNLVRGSNAVAPQTVPGIWHNILSTVLVSIPTATGNPFCPVIEMRILGDTTPHSVQCMLMHAGWGGGYLLLLACALGYTLVDVWRYPLAKMRMDARNRVFMLALAQLGRGYRGKEESVRADGIDQHQMLVRAVARVLLLAGALFAICVYVFSSGPVDQPGFHARYLVSLLIATPALLFPLWQAASGKLRAVQTTLERSKVFVCRSILLGSWLLLLMGTTIAFSEVPAALAVRQEREDLLHHLKHIGVTHFYTEYWTCYNLIFASHEQVICAILNRNLQPVHNRAPYYFDRVKADVHAAYVIPLQRDLLPADYDDLPAIEQMVAQAGPGKYRRYEFDGYVIYQPR